MAFVVGAFSFSSGMQPGFELSTDIDGDNDDDLVVLVAVDILSCRVDEVPKNGFWWLIRVVVVAADGMEGSCARVVVPDVVLGRKNACAVVAVRGFALLWIIVFEAVALDAPGRSVATCPM